MIKKIPATITHIKNLSASAKELTLQLSEPLHFMPGSFVNCFIEKDGVLLRRAYSISSCNNTTDTITLSIRLTPDGAITPLFWNNDYTGKTITIMGPLGVHTADTMQASRTYLFAFGIGAGVVKSLAGYFAQRNTTKELVIITGNRSDDDILYKDYFDNLAQQHQKVSVDYIVSTMGQSTVYKQGYIQHHLAGLDFNNSDVYICGREISCTQLAETIKETNPSNCNFFIEAFH